MGADVIWWAMQNSNDVPLKQTFRTAILGLLEQEAQQCRDSFRLPWVRKGSEMKRLKISGKHKLPTLRGGPLLAQQVDY